MSGRGPSVGPDGLAVVDKPAGWTSHDCVARCRKLLATRKVGHSGTLDPDATGVLLVGAGSVTRLLRFLGSLPKSYEAEVVLGVATSTLDAAGEVTATWDMSAVDAGAVTVAAAGLVGDILQVPPMVSAVSVGGRRLHELARAGVEVEREARPVTVHRLVVDPTADPLVYRVEVDCSSGTYVRVLAADLGRALGGGAHLRALRRTAIGNFTVGAAVPLDQVAPHRLLPPEAAVAHLDRVRVDPAVADQVGHGRVLSLEAVGVGAAEGSHNEAAPRPAASDADARSAGDADPRAVNDPGSRRRADADTDPGLPGGAGPGPVNSAGPWAVFDAEGRLLAVYERYRDGLAKPAVVLPAAQPRSAG